MGMVEPLCGAVLQWQPVLAWSQVESMRARSFLWVGSLAWLVLAGCDRFPGEGGPAPTLEPDWLEVADRRLPARVFTSPQVGVEVLWGPPRPQAQWSQQPAAWVWSAQWPQVRSLTLPVDGPARDVAFLDVGGRAQGVFESVSCSAAAHHGCVLENPFPAMSVVVMQSGSFRQLGIGRATQFRWGASGSVAGAEVIPLGAAARTGY